MNRDIDQAIVLRRVNYSERDRVVTLLSKINGKISVFAKGVRAQKSKLSAGIELLNINEVGIVAGKSNLKTLVSAKILVFNSEIVKNFQKTNSAFEKLKILDKIIEENQGQEYFDSLKTYLICLNDDNYDDNIVNAWFDIKIMQINGVMPDIKTDTKDAEHYYFDYEKQIFVGREGSEFSKNDIKLLRLLRDNPTPIKLTSESGSEDALLSFSKTLIQNNLDV